MQKLVLISILGLSILSTILFLNSLNSTSDDNYELKAYENLIQYDATTHVVTWDLSNLSLDNYQIIAIGKTIERGRIQQTIGTTEVYGLILKLDNNPFTDFSPVLSGITIGLTETLESLYLNVDNCNSMYWDSSFQDWIFPANLKKFNFSAVNTNMSYDGQQRYLAQVFANSDNVLNGLDLNLNGNYANLYTIGSPLLENINKKDYNLSYINLLVGQNNRSNYNLSYFQTNVVNLINNNKNIKTLELNLEKDYVTYQFLTDIENVIYPLIAQGTLTNVVLSVGDNGLDQAFVNQIFQDDSSIIKGSFVINC